MCTTSRLPRIPSAMAGLSLYSSTRASLCFRIRLCFPRSAQLSSGGGYWPAASKAWRAGSRQIYVLAPS
eukprot:4411221-Pyramimonas_sp.AAC.1